MPWIPSGTSSVNSGRLNKPGLTAKKPIKPQRNREELYGMLPATRTEPYDMLEIINGW